jgi:hypothetical protein
MTMFPDITANNLVKMNVIIDEFTNDIMSAVGHRPNYKPIRRGSLL